jgi:hypothetical protein
MTDVHLEDDDIPRKPNPPDIDGYLSKLKHKQSLFGSWNKRYFRVNGENLEYYKTKPKNNSDEEPSGVIDLSLIHAVRRFDGTSFQVSLFQIETSHSFSFSLMLDQWFISCVLIVQLSKLVG